MIPKELQRQVAHAHLYCSRRPTSLPAPLWEEIYAFATRQSLTVDDACAVLANTALLAHAKAQANKTQPTKKRRPSANKESQ